MFLPSSLYRHEPLGRVPHPFADRGHGPAVDPRRTGRAIDTGCRRREPDPRLERGERQ
jgi:hypothetical protein